MPRRSNTLTPELTVILVARAAARSIAATISSILAQRAVSVDLVVVDDGSCPGCVEVVRSFSDSRVRVLSVPGPQGTPGCWNRALAVSRSAWFTIVNEGDRILGSALAEMVFALEKDPAAGLAHACWFGVDEAGRLRLRAFREQRHAVRRRLPEDLDHRRALVVDGNVIQALPTYRRDVVVALGGFDESLGEDAGYALALRLLDRAEIRLVPKFLCARPAATAGASRSYWREVALCRALVRTGSVRFLEAAPYRLRRLVLAGLARRLWPERLRRLPAALGWRIRRALRAASPGRWLRGTRGSGRFYQKLVDRMSWWPLARVTESPQREAPAQIGYVLWRYPLLSETFIRREIHALRGAGVAVDVIADEPGEEETEDHPAAPTGKVTYLSPRDTARARRFARGFLWAHPLRVLHLLLYCVFHRYTREKSLRRDVAVLRAALQLADVLQELKVTHIHSPWADHHAFLALLASRLLRIPYSVQARAHEIHRRTATFALAEKLRNARFVVTNSAFNAAHLRPLLGDRADANLHTIYNGIDLAQFDAPTRGGNGPDRLRLVAVGRLVEQKGFDDLLHACALLRDRGRVFRCDIIGGPQEPEDTNAGVLLRKLHRRLGLESVVRFQGELPFSRILEAYRAADIFVLPCVVAADGGSDVTPNALIEAMAMRLPVVSTPIAAIPEIVEHGTSGVLVPPRDPAALADALSRLLADSGLRARLGAAARKKVEERFDIEENIRRYVALFIGAGSAGGGSSTLRIRPDTGL